MFAALLLLGGSAGAQELGQPKWGFDGRVVPNRFNLLTITVTNPTQQSIDKVLQLRKVNFGRTLGAPLEQRCYLGPGATRTMQFRPYISSGANSWTFDWKSRDASSVNVGAPRLGIGATVLFEAPDTPRIRRLKLTTFAPERLPTSADVMDGLREVILDQEPVVTPAQRDAFLDWLRRGGRVHILRNDRDEWPSFSEEFDVFRLTDDFATYGAGRIHRHDFKRARFEEKTPAEVFKQPTTVGSISQPAPLASKLRRQVLAIAVELNYGWGTIFGLAIVYLVLIGPVFYRLSTRSLSWYASLLLLAAMIGVATWMFAVIGARGGEVSQSRSWSYARLAGSDYEVTRYSLVFITAGGDYEFTSDAPAIFSSAQDNEFIEGAIQNGNKPSYALDMPRNSQRLVIQKSRLPGPPANQAFNGVEFKTDLPLRETLYCVHRTHLLTYRKLGRNSWREVGRQRLSQFVRNYEAQYQTMDVRDVLIDRLHLRSLDLDEDVTEREQFIFFGSTGDGGAPEEFRLRGKGPSLDLGADQGRTVFRFDFYTDQ